MFPSVASTVRTTLAHFSRPSRGQTLCTRTKPLAMATTGKQTAVRVVSVDPQKIAGFDNVQAQDIDIPNDSSSALVKIQLRPINPFDVLVMSGLVPIPPPFTVGSEAVGTIVNSPSGKFSEGTRVVATGWPAGTWSSYAAVDEASLVAVPDGVSDEAAAQFVVNSMTAVGLVDNAAVPQGEYLLQAAAGGVVGLQVTAYAKHLGIKTIGVVRRETPELKAAGADEVIISTKEDVVARVKEITGGVGAYAALDPIAGTFTSTLLNAVRNGGTVYVYSTLTGEPVTAQTMDLMAGAKAVRGFVSGGWLQGDGPAKAAERMEKTLQLIADGVITPPKAVKTFKLEDYSEAIKAHLAAGRGGKIFLAN